MVSLVTALALLCATLAGCSPNSDAVRVDGTTVYLSGRIDQAMAERFSALNLSSGQAVEINSGGGDVPSALRIAEKLQTSGAKLVVGTKCMSACASIILPSARRRSARDGAVIALHGTQTGLLQLFRRTQTEDNHSIPQSADLAGRAAREQDIYSKAGVDQRLLLLPYTHRGQLCYANVRQPNGSRRFAIGTERPAYVVSIATLSAFGLDFEQSDKVGSVKPAHPATVTPEQVEREFGSLQPRPCP